MSNNLEENKLSKKKNTQIYPLSNYQHRPLSRSIRPQMSINFYLRQKKREENIWKEKKSET